MVELHVEMYLEASTALPKFEFKLFAVEEWVCFWNHLDAFVSIH